MVKLALSSATSAAWFVAVLGAAAILVGPITPWVPVVEIIGSITCFTSAGTLAALFFRR